MKKWATLHMKDLKTQRTVDMEILMQILCTHMTLANSSLQEAIIKVGSLAESGLRRFFSAWPKVPAERAVAWNAESPGQLHGLLGLQRRDGRGYVCCRLHTHKGGRFPLHLLTAQPSFEVWIKRSKGRVQLAMSFKIIVLTDEGVLSSQPNCVYGERDLERSKELGVKVLRQAAEMGTQISSNFYRLIGHWAAAMMTEGLESRAAAQRAERQRRRQKGLGKRFIHFRYDNPLPPSPCYSVLALQCCTCCCAWDKS
eukprot:6199157-Pleurochrysis_carterae.AAC.3